MNDLQIQLEKIRYILASHTETSDLAERMDSMNLRQRLQHCFTLAIAGQMKTGKSTLLNAILGEDKALVGINECTATINRFLHSEDPKLQNRFRAYWKDGNITDMHMNEAQAWIGESSYAENTIRLDMYSASRFLEQAIVIDTPGLRTTITTHNRLALDVIGTSVEESQIQSMHQLSEQYIYKADAILYVLNPVGRYVDQDILDQFSENNRLFGVHTYNSIAVIQKWEHLWQDINVDPEQLIKQKCQILKNQLEGRITDVLAVSGLLSRSLFWLNDNILEKLIELGSMDKEVVRQLILGESFFLEDEITSLSISPSQRAKLYNQIRTALEQCIDSGSARASSWAILSFYLKLICKEQINDINDLRNRIKKLSGIDELKDIITQNFFRQAEMIKTGTLLKTAFEICKIAAVRLDEKAREREVLIESGHIQKQKLVHSSKPDKTPKRIVKYIEESITAISENLQTIKTSRKNLIKMMNSVNEDFKDFEKDIIGLKEIESGGNADISEAEKEELEHLFGLHGTSILQRLNLEEVSNEELLHDHLTQRLKYWSKKIFNSNYRTELIYSNATAKIERILDELEKPD